MKKILLMACLCVGGTLGSGVARAETLGSLSAIQAGAGNFDAKAVRRDGTVIVADEKDVLLHEQNSGKDSKREYGDRTTLRIANRKAYIREQAKQAAGVGAIFVGMMGLFVGSLVAAGATVISPGLFGVGLAASVGIFTLVGAVGAKNKPETFRNETVTRTVEEHRSK